QSGLRLRHPADGSGLRFPEEQRGCAMTMTREAPGDVSHRDERSRPSAGRTGIVVLLILSILATAGARYLSDQRRYAVLTNNGAVPLPTARGANLSSMNSFALALLLGGLRGPLVM